MEAPVPLVPPDAPEEVRRRAAGPARVPEFDPTLGLPVQRASGPEPRHRLVTIGDSLTHGFQSGAIHNTDLSWPAILAYELGWFDQYRFPIYPGFGGLGLNLEYLLRDLEEHLGPEISWWEAPEAAVRVLGTLTRADRYWARGAGAEVPPHAYVHDLAVYGWTLHDALTVTAASCQATIDSARDRLVELVVSHSAERAALRVYPDTQPAYRHETVFDTAARLGAEGDDGPGIETLVVMLGANNALQSVTDLRVRWTDDTYAAERDGTGYTVWDPVHFREELDQVRQAVERIDARHVIFCTVPHVTIAPIARAVGTTKARPGSRYFPFYTRPWISDADFDPAHDPHLTENEARAVDTAIDCYNDAITAMVRAARSGPAPRDWLLFDLSALLDRLATKRYLRDPSAKPAWWTPYPLPAELTALDPVPNTVFLSAKPGGGRADGGLFSLDGVHPTTVAYGLVADELARIMAGAGVEFRSSDGAVRPDPHVDFARLVARDSLITSPPRLVDETLRVLGWCDQTLDWVDRVLHRRPRPAPPSTRATTPTADVAAPATA
ncbi:hypothetical protein FHX74_001397 [Friedmanniella endophytica]|uniref:GDSL-like Lipase/Acylhydrolase n=1 Tax=Microlunatus kandeliicorticis TaxID=1759536 RepID=A0A7W3IRA3_9ACTN|nr:hypothetical protein [Microlunatus kandeliicorticis]MBA8793792.1 hypothetical protein [Microlunatus kandeliicorticis]